VPTAQFVFINRPNADIALLFRKRLQGAFAQLKLNFDEYSVFLSSLNREDYLNLNLVADIYLDTISWSGGNTTLEAIACNLPVVTYPGEFMRGRHSYAMLKMLGVTDTIASSEAEYIDIAVRLGNEPQWRANIVEKIKANHSKLYDDTECVRALEKFYQSVS
jgi:predicted O-linked N-acetylglucosamine transferase (SPINDLY family)